MSLWIIDSLLFFTHKFVPTNTSARLGDEPLVWAVRWIFL